MALAQCGTKRRHRRNNSNVNHHISICKCGGRRGTCVLVEGPKTITFPPGQQRQPAVVVVLCWQFIIIPTGTSTTTILILRFRRRWRRVSRHHGLDESLPGRTTLENRWLILLLFTHNSAGSLFSCCGGVVLVPHQRPPPPHKINNRIQLLDARIGSHSLWMIHPLA
jgi:hypothetical protein